MIISEIYKKFGIPPNLQEHMLRVSSIVEFLQQHWIGEEIDWNLVLTAALLHDLGNGVKFDLDAYPEFLGSEKENVDYWKSVQSKTIQKYGSNDHQATKKMLQEIDIEKPIVDVILQKSFGNSTATRDSHNWATKILFYSDLRTLPFGIGSLSERLDDIRERMPQYTSRDDFEDLIKACQEIEEQITANLNVSVKQINDENIILDYELLKFETN